MGHGKLLEIQNVFQMENHQHHHQSSALNSSKSKTDGWNASKLAKKKLIVCLCVTKDIPQNIATRHPKHSLIMIARPDTLIQEDQKAKNQNGDASKAHAAEKSLDKPVGMTLETMVWKNLTSNMMLKPFLI